MLAISGAVICLAFILGLLSAGFSATVLDLPVGAIVLLGTGTIFSWFMPRLWRKGVRSDVWLAAGFVGCVAVLYFLWRFPHPTATDISQLISSTKPETVQVEGKITTSPRLTQSQRIQFNLAIERVLEEAGKPKTIAPPTHQPGSTTSVTSATPTGNLPPTGNLYITVPLLQGTGLYPNQTVRVTGSLYLPKPATNPGSFDFKQYLARQGIFAGFSGKTVESLDPTYHPPLLWSVQHRIIQAQVEGAGMPAGALISAMVMGGKTVDLPFELRDRFKTVGLAHALAASGAQVSLLLGVVLSLTQRSPAKLRLAIGTATLLLYLGLTGLEAAVLRAGVMGFVALLALTIERKVKPLASILFTATLLLLWNPLWIFDLGFQFSFLATLGLMVTVPVLSEWLDWMPTAITPLFAVPIAAYLWTLPLSLFTFGVVSPYSILINIIVSPLITIISIGGMISAIAALIHPILGSETAWLLSYPTQAFIQLANWGSQLPGSSYAVGTISLLQLVLLYGLFGLVWMWRRSHRYWWVASIGVITLVAIPAWYAATHLLQVTLLTTRQDPIVVVQDRGKVGLINGGNETEAKFTVLPFLQQQGINQIDWALVPNLDSSIAGWERILATIPIHEFYSNVESIAPVQQVSQISSSTTAQQAQSLAQQIQSHQGRLRTIPKSTPLQLATPSLHLLSLSPFVAKLHLADQDWLFLNDLPPLDQQVTTLTPFLSKATTLWWTGAPLHAALLDIIQPQTIITTRRSISPAINLWLHQHGITPHLSDQDGSIQWTPDAGFQTLLTPEQ